jgi:3-oxoacyl-[acyl-carrier protein] reductase
MTPVEPKGHDLLAGKVALVTAAAGTGIGSATARRLLTEGATVVVSDAHERRLAETVEALGGDVLSVPCDVTNEEQVGALFAAALATHGRIDVVVNNAGLGGTAVIVNNASVLGWRAQAGQAHYAAAKAGVMALTRSAAIEAAPHGVRVNAVAPSLAMHPFLAKVTSDELLDELAAKEAFGRPAEPWEVATVIAFLASDYSTYMTGEVVSVSSQHP